jgi:hypothetical protein
VVAAVQQYIGKPPQGSPPEDGVTLAQLGESTAIKCWLIASLEKTLREQTPPSLAVTKE